MNNFLSLKEFLLLQKNSNHIQHLSGEKWVRYYEIAKNSYKRFGNEGPPIGSIVETLVSGHGGLGGNIRNFDGLSSDGKCFIISYKSYGKRESSCVDYKKWWLEIKLYEPLYVIVNRALESITKEEILKQCNDWGWEIDLSIVEKWQTEKGFMHPNREEILLDWFREKEILC